MTDLTSVNPPHTPQYLILDVNNDQLEVSQVFFTWAARQVCHTMQKYCLRIIDCCCRGLKEIWKWQQQRHQLQISVLAACSPMEGLITHALSMSQQLKYKCNRSLPHYHQTSTSVVLTECTLIQAAAWLRPVACQCQLCCNFPILVPCSAPLEVLAVNHR